MTTQSNSVENSEPKELPKCVPMGLVNRLTAANKKLENARKNYIYWQKQVVFEEGSREQIASIIAEDYCVSPNDIIDDKTGIINRKS